MIYFILGFFCVAVAHFIYQALAVPALLMELRLDLLTLRAELRRLRGGQAESADAQQFRELQESLDALIRNLERFDAAALLAIEGEMRTNPDFKRRLAARLSVLDSAALPEIRAIRARSLRIALKATLVNNGGAAIYLVPVALAVRGLKSVNSLVREAVSVPERDRERLRARYRDSEAALT